MPLTLEIPYRQTAGVTNVCRGRWDGREKLETWLVDTESWYFSAEEMKGACISVFTRSVSLSLFSLPGSSLFLPGWHSFDGSGGWGWGEERKEEKVVVKLRWPARRYFRSASRRIPGF